MTRGPDRQKADAWRIITRQYGPLIDQIEAAEMLGVTKSSVCWWLQVGRLTAVHVPSPTKPRPAKVRLHEVLDLVEKAGAFEHLPRNVITQPEVRRAQKEMEVLNERAEIARLEERRKKRVQKGMRKALPPNVL